MFENKKIMDQYKKMMESEGKSYEEVQEFISKNKMESLYRYREIRFLESELLDGMVKLSTAKEFNDPFDCGFYLDFKKYLMKANKRIQETYGVILNSIPQSINSMPEIKKMLDDYKMLNLVSCFTEECDNILMWSHYAQEHEGVCIEYNYNLIPIGIRCCIFPVIYSKDKYDISSCLAKHSVNIARNASFYKNDIWKYEREWRYRIDADCIENLVSNENRLRLPDKNIEFLKIPKAISAIYFGAKFDYENPQFQNIIEKLYKKSKEQNIKFYKMEVSIDKESKMIKEEIKDIRQYYCGAVCVNDEKINEVKLQSKKSFKPKTHMGIFISIILSALLILLLYMSFMDKNLIFLSILIGINTILVLPDLLESSVTKITGIGAFIVLIIIAIYWIAPILLDISTDAFIDKMYVIDSVILSVSVVCVILNKLNKKYDL